MPNTLVLLPGWGLGVAALQPLALALEALDGRLQVQLEPLPAFNHSDLDMWLTALDGRLPAHCWLAGWSFGGMLAAELAARRGERCAGLITLGTNGCFVARKDWPQAMPEQVFQRFQQGCQADAAQTLKRFALLCAQGSASRGLVRQLQSAVSLDAPNALQAGLSLLAQLDIRGALQQFTGPQLHLLAGADALVPAQAALALLNELGDVEVELIEDVSHAFVLEQAQAVAARVLTFLGRATDD